MSVPPAQVPYLTAAERDALVEEYHRVAGWPGRSDRAAEAVRYIHELGQTPLGPHLWVACGLLQWAGRGQQQDEAERLASIRWAARLLTEWCERWYARRYGVSEVVR